MYRYLDLEQPTTAKRTGFISVQAKQEHALSFVVELETASTNTSCSTRGVDLGSDDKIEESPISRTNKSRPKADVTAVQRKGVTPKSSPRSAEARAEVCKKLRTGEINCKGLTTSRSHRVEEHTSITRGGQHDKKQLSHDQYVAETSLDRQSCRDSVNSQPGAFRMSPGEASCSPMERTDNRELSISIPVSIAEQCEEQNQPPPPVHEALADVLVNAELVTTETPTEPEAKTWHQLVQALPFEEKFPSFFEFVRESRKLQVGLCTIVLAVIMLIITLAVIGGKGQSELKTIAPSPNELFARDVLAKELSANSLDKLDEVLSPQYDALDWITQDPELRSYSNDRILQRYALASFYFATGGPTTWNNRDGWLSYQEHECSWHTSRGNATSICQAGQVEILDLERNKLGGYLPEDISLLTGLTQFSISVNAIRGTIPETVIQSLTNLKHFSADYNLLTGLIPTELGILTELTELSLSSNALTGSLPSELGALTKMTLLEADVNFLAGSLPTQLGSATALELLWLLDNKLTGPIPSDIGNLSLLQFLLLEDNILTGTIPSELQRLHNIEYLSLQRNSLDGTIPMELSALTSMEIFNVGNNTLTGTLPANLSLAESLFFLSAYGNSLSGSIPSEYGLLTHMLEFYLDDNDLTGTLPTELGNLRKMAAFWVNGNTITGSMPLELCALTSSTMIIVDCDFLNCDCAAAT